jgi:hypothetical protein
MALVTFNGGERACGNMSGKVVNNPFHGQWLSKGNTRHPVAPQQYKLERWLFSLYILGAIKPFPKIKKRQHMISKDKPVLFIPHEIGDHIPTSFNL